MSIKPSPSAMSGTGSSSLQPTGGPPSLPASAPQRTTRALPPPLPHGPRQHAEREPHRPAALKLDVASARSAPPPLPRAALELDIASSRSAPPPLPRAKDSNSFEFESSTDDAQLASRRVPRAAMKAHASARGTLARHCATLTVIAVTAATSWLAIDLHNAEESMDASSDATGDNASGAPRVRLASYQRATALRGSGASGTTPSMRLTKGQSTVFADESAPSAIPVIHVAHMWIAASPDGDTASRSDAALERALRAIDEETSRLRPGTHLGSARATLTQTKPDPQKASANSQPSANEATGSDRSTEELGPPQDRPATGVLSREGLGEK